MKNMPESFGITIAGLAEKLHREYKGEGNTKITGFASLENAGTGDLVFLARKKYWKKLENSQASAVLLPDEEDYDRIPVIYSPDPYHDFIRVIDMFHHPYRPQAGIHDQARVASTAELGKNVSVGAFSVIGENAKIGKGTIIYPHTVIYPGVRLGEDCVVHSHVSIREGSWIGDRVILHNGVVIGSDGFGYLQDEQGRQRKIPQTGQVILQDNTEVGANSTIDRAVLDDTVIGEGTKIDNLVQIAHNVRIGKHCVIMSQAGIAGSSRLGNNVIVSGQVGIADHLDIGDNVVIAAKTGVTGSVPADSVIAGYPHLDIRTWRKSWASIPRLYQLIRDVRKMKKRLDDLSKR